MCGSGRAGWGSGWTTGVWVLCGGARLRRSTHIAVRSTAQLLMTANRATRARGCAQSLAGEPGSEFGRRIESKLAKNKPEARQVWWGNLAKSTLDLAKSTWQVDLEIAKSTWQLELADLASRLGKSNRPS